MRKRPSHPPGKKLNEYSKLEYGSVIPENEGAGAGKKKEEKMTLSEEEREKADAEIKGTL